MVDLFFNVVYRLAIFCLKRDFGTECKGEEPGCWGCKAYKARKFLESII